MGLSKLQELRTVIGTAFHTTFVNAATDAWNTTNAAKTRCTVIDEGALGQEGIDDESIHSRLYKKLPNHPGLRTGEMKWSMYADGAPSDVAPGDVGDFLEAAMGGMANPTNARSMVATGTCSTTNFTAKSADTYVVPGQAALIGSKGDGKGGGEVKIITAVDSGGFQYYPACAGAPASGDTAVFSSAAYLDEDATQKYVDTLRIGSDSADQKQTVGGALTVEIEGTAAGELPILTFTSMVADHQYVEAAGDRAAFDHAAAAGGEDPAHDRAIGLVHIGDAQATARTSRKVSGVTITPNLELIAQPEPGGVNGIGGWVKGGGVPEAECSILFDQDMPGLANDYNVGTAKSVIFQFGHEATKTIAFVMPSCYLADLPIREDADGLTAVKIKLRADEDYDAGNTDLNRSAMVIHRF